MKATSTSNYNCNAHHLFKVDENVRFDILNNAKKTSFGQNPKP
jgi:hypothetical protein